MTYNLEAMKANLTFGGARPNKFNVIVNNRVDPSSDFKFEFLCKAASLPTDEIGMIDVYFKGRPIKVVGDRPPFAPWTITVYNDEDFLIRNAFERWMSSMNAHQNNTMSLPSTPNPYSYKSDLVVTQTSHQNDFVPLKRYRFIGASPSLVSDVTLDWETQNQIETFDVTFAYDYWVSEGTTDGV